MKNANYKSFSISIFLIFFLINDVDGADTLIRPLKYDFPQQTGYANLHKSDPNRTKLIDSQAGGAAAENVSGFTSVVAPTSLPQNEGAATQNVTGGRPSRDTTIDWFFAAPTRLTSVKISIYHDVPEPTSKDWGYAHPGKVCFYGADDQTVFLSVEEPDVCFEIPFEKGTMQEITLKFPDEGLIVQKLRSNFIARRYQTILSEVTFYGHSVDANDLSKAQLERDKTKLPPFEPVTFWPVESFGKTKSTDSIFGVCGHMLHSDVFFPGNQTGKGFDPFWRVENTLPFIVNGNLSWVREPLYPFFTDDDGNLIKSKTDVIEKYLALYDKAGIKIVLAPMWNPEAVGKKSFITYFTWISELAQKYPCVSAIEFHNEPNLKPFFAGSAAEYVEGCKAAYKILKEGAPDTIIAGGAFAGWGYLWTRDELLAECKGDPYCIGLKWTELVLEAGLLEACDAISAHPYRATSPPEGGTEWESNIDPQGFEKELHYWWDLIQKYNKTSKSLKIYFTEIGWASSHMSAAGVGSMQKQADYLSRFMMILLNSRINGLPLEGVFWYSAKSTDISTGENDDGATGGLVTWDLSYVKPVYVYYKQLAESFDKIGKLKKANLALSFNNWPAVIKHYTWQKSDGKIVIPFWRLNQLQSRDIDFASVLELKNFQGKAKSVVLHDLSEGCPRPIGFRQEEADLKIPLWITARASWIEIAME